MILKAVNKYLTAVISADPYSKNTTPILFLLGLFRRLLKYSVYLLLFPIVLLIRLIAPFLVVRFIGLWSLRLGHYVGNTNVYLAEKLAGYHSLDVPVIDLFYDSRVVCNQFVSKLWRRVLPVNNFFRLVAHANAYFPGGEKHDYDITVDWDRYGCIDVSTSPWVFTQRESLNGHRFLDSLGIRHDDSIVLVHARTNEYLNQHLPSNDWSHHNHRNSDIDSFIAAGEALAENGCYVFRMGAVVDKPLECENPRIIDYATHHRTEFLDIFLGQKCLFYLGDPCGYHAVPIMFKKVLALTNALSVGQEIRPLLPQPCNYHCGHVELETERGSVVSPNANSDFLSPWYSRGHSLIFKKFWQVAEERYLSFEEMVTYGSFEEMVTYGKFIRSGRVESDRPSPEKELEYHQNTEDEIRDLAVEVFLKLKGRSEPSAESRDRQAFFWSKFKEIPQTKDSILVDRCAIGDSFLKKHFDTLFPERS